jgi:hypothetical protein
MKQALVIIRIKRASDRAQNFHRNSWLYSFDTIKDEAEL